MDVTRDYSQINAHKWKLWEIAGIGLVAYLIFVPGAIGTITGFFSGLNISGAGGGAVAGAQPGKIAIQVNDPLAGSGNNAPTLAIYPQSSVVVGGVTYGPSQIIESPTVTSAGVATTAAFYPPGAQLIGKLTLSNYETEYWKFTYPGASASQVQGGQWPTVILYQPKLATITISLTDGSGNTYASAGNDINFTNSGACTSGNNCLGVSSTTLTVTITNTVANTGYISTFDPQNNVNWCLAGSFKEGTSGSPNKATYSGMPVGFTVGSQRFYATNLNGGFGSVPAGANFTPQNSGCNTNNISSGGLTEQTVGTTTNGGSLSFKFTAGVGSLTHGNTIVDSIQVWEYADLTYAAANSGVFSPSAVQLGSTFTFTLAA
ncbi:MAG: hypothetical protein KGI38_11800 [Thaumarchaeota archaeon]|nr:hypothetical protein [Nitrososphaerota archaeon]